MDREASLELLRKTHEFPGPYRFRVVVRAGETAAVVSAVAAAVKGGVIGVSEQPSRNGTYVSVRVSVRVEAPEVVLDVYEVLGALDAVIATL
jgi:putative lipoic acid-binding regulatory protein